METARALAVKGSHVVMFCRNLNATEIVKDNILNERVTFFLFSEANKVIYSNLFFSLMLKLI